MIVDCLETVTSFQNKSCVCPLMLRYLFYILTSFNVFEDLFYWIKISLSWLFSLLCWLHYSVRLLHLIIWSFSSCLASINFVKFSIKIKHHLHCTYCCHDTILYIVISCYRYTEVLFQYCISVWQYIFSSVRVYFITERSESDYAPSYAIKIDMFIYSN